MTKKILIASLLALTPLLALAGAPPAHSAQVMCDDYPTPDVPPYCPVNIVWQEFGPEQPECDLDDPRAPRCTPGDMATYTFEAVNPANTQEISNLCTVKLEGVTPSDAFGTGFVRFRTRVICDHNLRHVAIESKLVDKTTMQTIAFSSSASCHGCGRSPVDSLGSRGELGNDEYLLITTVRMILEEGQPPGDPWATTPGLPPDDTSNGTCTPGGTITKCKLVLPIKSTKL
jgi:hypothetical protein